MKRLFIVIVPILAQNYLALGQNTYTVCKGDTVRLMATGGNLYEWQPHTGLDNPFSSNPIASPDTTTVYHIIKLQTSVNLIQNGDFSEGNQGFTSDYRDSSNVVREGYYAIATTPRAAHFAFRTCTDHSSGTGNMMVVNGSHFPNKKVWQQQITVRPNTKYAFSAYVNAGISGGDNAILQFSINGQLLSSATTFQNIRCTWQQFYAVWNSDTAITATIAVVNQNTQFVGNDFALDDILFQSFTTATDSATVQVKQTPAKPTVTVSAGGSRFCQGNSRVITCQGTAGTIPLWNNGSRQRSQTVTTDSTLWVKVEATNGCISKTSDTTEFVAWGLPETPVVSIVSDTGTLCEGDSALLWADVALRPGNSHYAWNTTQHADSLWVKESGNYSAVLVSAEGCESHRSNQIHVNFFDRPDNPILTRFGNVMICAGSALVVSSQNQPGTYNWSSGDTGRSLTITEPGRYVVQVESSHGCLSPSSDTLHLTVAPLPDTPTILTLPGDTLMSSVVATTYVWKKDLTVLSQNTRKIRCTAAGAYSVQAVSVDGCQSAASAEYIANPVSVAASLENENLTIAPNPVWSAFRIRGLHHGEGIMRVTDAAGRLIGKWEIEEDEAIEAQGWAAGIYLVRVQEEETVTTLKLLKN